MGTGKWNRKVEQDLYDEEAVEESVGVDGMPSTEAKRDEDTEA